MKKFLATAAATLTVAITALAQPQLAPLQLRFDDALETGITVSFGSGWANTTVINSTDPEFAQFTGDLTVPLANWNGGAFNVFFLENGVTLSDRLAVNWFRDTSVQGLLHLTAQLLSDTEANPLNPGNVVPDQTLPETGNFQSFTSQNSVPAFPPGVQIDVRSDVEVPDGGNTMLLMGLAAIGVTALRQRLAA